MPADNPTCAPAAQYRPIEGHPRYRVVDDGRVQSFRKGQWRDLRFHHRGKGYRVVQLGAGKDPVRRCVHHLVLEAFVGPRPSGAVARHLDGDKENNAASNLRWGTLADNVRDSLRHGTHGNTKTTVEQVRAILGSSEPTAVLAERFGIPRDRVQSIRRRSTWAWV